MYRRKYQGWVKHLDFIILDVLCLQAAFAAAYMLRHGLRSPYEDLIYRNISLILILIDVLVLLGANSFKNVLKRGYLRELKHSVRHAVLVVVTASFYLSATQTGGSYSRLTFFYMGGLYALFTFIVRIIWKNRMRSAIRSREREKSMLVVTTRERAESLLENLQSDDLRSFSVTGVICIDRDCRGEIIGGVPVAASAETAAEFVCREWVDEIMMSLRPGLSCTETLIEQFLEMGLVVHIDLEQSAHLLGPRKFVERIGSCTVISTSINYMTPFQVLWKRLFDIAGGLAGCAATGLLFLVLAPWIYVKSPGPIFFAQTRVGRNGKKFQMYKFRSMYLDAEERKAELQSQNRVKGGMMFKLDWDPRIIGSRKLPDGTVKKGIGNYIRDLSLDEFPQFFNVLKGDMSLVGTRPPTVDEWEKYDLRHRGRLAIKPGITGMWQVSGRSNITDFEEIVKLDKQYISQWSMGLDLKILFKTVAAVVKRDGAR